MQRRDFILSGLSLSAVAYLGGISDIARALSPATSPKASPYLVVADTDLIFNKTAYGLDTKNRKANDISGRIAFKNLLTGELSSFDVPVWAHIFDQHPNRSHIFVGPGKWTSSAVVFDYKAQKTVTVFKAPSDYRFFGHSCFTPDGQYVFLSAHSTAKNNGILCLYDCESWRLSKVIDSGGHEPHECAITPDEQLCVVNTKTKETSSNGTLSFFDLKTLKLTQNITCPGAGHIVFMDGNNVALGGLDGPTTELILFQINLTTKKIVSIRDSKLYPEKKILSEALSLCPLSKEVVAVTLPNLSEIMIWNTATNNYKFVPVQTGALGLAKMDNKLFLNCKSGGDIAEFKVSSDGTGITLNSAIESHIGNGRHMRLVYI